MRRGCGVRGLLISGGVAGVVLLAGCGAGAERAVQSGASITSVASPDAAEADADADAAEADPGAGGSASSGAPRRDPDAVVCPPGRMGIGWGGDLASEAFGAPAPRTPEGALKMDFKRSGAFSPKMAALPHERIADSKGTVTFAGRRQDGTVAWTTTVQRSTRFERWLPVAGSRCEGPADPQTANPPSSRP